MQFSRSIGLNLVNWNETFFISRKGIGDTLTKTIKQLSKEIAEHLGIDPLQIKFEDLGDEDSRFYTQEEYVGINKKYKDNIWISNIKITQLVRSNYVWTYYV